MKNPMEVLRNKEQELLRVKKEVDALRIAVTLLGDDTSHNNGRSELRQVVEMP